MTTTPHQPAQAEASAGAAASSPAPCLPEVPAWLDEVEGEQALAWVDVRNNTTRAVYETDPIFEQLREGIEEILDSTDKIPGVSLAAGYLYNFWTDAEHPRGLWRRTTWDSYRAGGPQAGGTTQWEILLDLDALGQAEGVTWVWHGASVLRTGPLAGHRALIDLSDGGSDTDVTRELDLDTLTFIDPADGGFYRSSSKGSMTWADDEGQSVLVTADWGPGSLTTSGYPRQVRRARRGQDLAEAEVLLCVPPTSMVAGAARDRQGRTWLSEQITFYTSRTWLLPDDATRFAAEEASRTPDGASTVSAEGARLIEVPESAEVSAAWDYLLIHLREPWTTPEQTYPTGSLLAAPLAAWLDGDRHLTTLFTPTASAFLQGWTHTAHHLVLSLLDDVVASLQVLTPPQPGAATDGPWDRQDLDPTALTPSTPAPAPDGAAGGDPDPTLLRPGRALVDLAAGAVDSLESDDLWMTISSFTQPTTLALGSLGPDGRLASTEVLRQAPSRYDATGVVATQHVAISTDGTRVPYFQVGRPTNGPAPTILYGYGGFEIPMGVGYLAVTGKAWLERGGTYVIAGIRGGGEYGPAWHRAGLKENRHRVYEDFAAVARALVKRGVTIPERLAVHGGSNGGLLVGNMLTQYPELVGAVVCEVPLLDMQRYTHLLAGASWEAEYGDPDDPDQWEFIRTFSPFHLLREGVGYPPVLLVTSTRDDRVHPAHARTMAYRMLAMGQDVTYFENSEGGHGRASTNAQRAWVGALIHTFAWRRLG
ncbi:prolyl oligopeptidase family serine peptidase [Actinomyces faecalis]|uniref:prolyl oligopeptidase family serine peptidase n=1 Tax=Actinomyces faecalis TaxID=2722820 RepID=UPI001554D081|nr:prolyl oligopeptidase family serine peptidase [Actinomyces faecalis]